MACANIVPEVSEGVLRLEIRRPEKKNALTLRMYAALTEALVSAERDAEIRAVLVHGQPNMFTSGNDLADFLQNPPVGDDHPAYAFVRKISTFDKAIVAAVTGSCIGVGATMLLHCDLVYAAKTRFSRCRSSTWAFARKPAPAYCFRQRLVRRARPRS